MRNVEHPQGTVNPSNNRQRLAAAIAADLLSERPVTLIPTCFTCSRDFTPTPIVGDANTARFCSQRCMDAYDEGFTVQPQPDVFTTPWRQIAGPDPGFMPSPMRSGRHGFMIKCAGCAREFDSQGLRCCSITCERTYRERQENERLRQEVGMERPQKRKCEAPGCHADIPNWRNGRLVSKAVRFCSPRCARKAARLGAKA